MAIWGHRDSEWPAEDGRQDARSAMPFAGGETAGSTGGDLIDLISTYSQPAWAEVWAAMSSTRRCGGEPDRCFGLSLTHRP